MTRDRPKFVRRSAFSLLELVIVMVIVGTMAAIALPRLSQAAAGQRLDAAAERVIADIERARTRARAASKSVSLDFDLASGSYLLSGVGGRAQTIELDERPFEVKLNNASFGSGDTVTFNAYGVPDNAGTIVLTAGGDTVTIQLYANGETKR